MTAVHRLRHRSMDRVEVVVLIVFAAISLWVLSLDLWQVFVHGRSWTGTDGVFAQDQLGYLAWIRAASHHLLISNLFVLRPTANDYFEPLIAISGGLTALGIAPSLALFVWKPVAVGAVFLATRTYVNRVIEPAGARHVALGLALFAGFIGLGPDLWLPFWSWGYPFALIALAAMVTALLTYQRDRATDRISLVPALLAAFAAWLHPWQGETLILIVLGAEAIMGGRWTTRRSARLLLTVLAAAVPLACYAILVRVDLSWGLLHGVFHVTYPLWKLALATVVLALPAVLAYRALPRTFLTSLTLMWPIAALCIFIASQTSIGDAPTHALLGITIPLALLAVKGVQQSPPPRFVSRRGLAILAIAIFIVPVAVYQLNNARRLAAPTPGNGNFVNPGERQALSYLSHDTQPGGVLSDYYLGTLVPAATGRRTFVGVSFWSQPDFVRHAMAATDLLSGRMTAKAARAFVVKTGARFVLSDCLSHADLRSPLAPITTSVHQFGCATLYVVQKPPPLAPPKMPW
jgi:hypothetical protein